MRAIFRLNTCQNTLRYYTLLSLTIKISIYKFITLCITIPVKSLIKASGDVVVYTPEIQGC